MDSEIRANIDGLISDFIKAGTTVEDPVSKLLITALVHQSQKIRDEISDLPDKVMERMCTYFIPGNKLDATPALCLVQVSAKCRKGMEPHSLTDGSSYSFRIDSKQTLSYFPLYRNYVIPVEGKYMLTSGFLSIGETRISLNLAKKGIVWAGFTIPTEVDTLECFSLYIKGTGGVLPKRISTMNGATELSFAAADNMAEIRMMEPFDSQQASPASLEVFSGWRNIISNSGDGKLIYITDSLKDRDTFKFKAFPKQFQQILESGDLDRFKDNTLWLQLDFGDEYDVPTDMEIIPNVVPVVNISVNTVNLTQSSPIARLTKGDGSYFLNVAETSLSDRRRGFSAMESEVVIRDFDSSCYDPSNLHRDVRRLYNRFVEDYHAFVDYHGLKDGELVRSLRELVNRIGKSVMTLPEARNRYDEGTYAMRNMDLIGQTASVKVTYLTTFGRLGNIPKAGMLMENRKDAALEKDVKVVCHASGGEDKASADMRYEMLRYYTLTADRLYTRMDIDAFLRLRLVREFGSEEMKRISYSIEVKGAGGPERLMRGLYIDLKFKDRKNYDRALSTGLDSALRQSISDRSCISMPIIVRLTEQNNG